MQIISRMMATKGSAWTHWPWATALGQPQVINCAKGRSVQVAARRTFGKPSIGSTLVPGSSEGWPFRAFGPVCQFYTGVESGLTSLLRVWCSFQATRTTTTTPKAITPKEEARVIVAAGQQHSSGSILQLSAVRCGFPNARSRMPTMAFHGSIGSAC